MQLVKKQIDPFQSLLRDKNSKVFFLPGNHDPVCLFTPGADIGEYRNAHSTVHKIGEKLYLGGLGGAVPGFEEGKTGKMAFPGFPYKTQEQLSAESRVSFDALEKVCADSQLLLVTHCGPSLSQSSLLFEFGKQFLTGATAHDEFVRRNHSQIPLYVHGHAHNAGTLVKCEFTRL